MLLHRRCSQIPGALPGALEWIFFSWGRASFPLGEVDFEAELINLLGVYPQSRFYLSQPLFYWWKLVTKPVSWQHCSEWCYPTQIFDFPDRNNN